MSEREKDLAANSLLVPKNERSGFSRWPHTSLLTNHVQAIPVKPAEPSKTKMLPNSM
jgi:hypothetical protein